MEEKVELGNLYTHACVRVCKWNKNTTGDSKTPDGRHKNGHLKKYEKPEGKIEDGSFAFFSP